MPHCRLLGPILLIAAIAAVAAGCAASGPPAAPRGVANLLSAARPAATTPAFPFPVIEAAGDPATLGADYARQLRRPMHELLDRYLHRWFRNEPARFLAYTAANGFARFMAPHHYAELHAAADAADLKFADLLLAQCFLDLSPMTACSAIALPAAAFDDGLPRLARNLDFPALDIADRHSVVVIFRPAGRYQFAAVTWPGLLGVLSGMNEHGLVLVNMEVDRPRRLPSAMPYTYLYRTILEDCRTVDEAVALLHATPRQTPNNLLLMDASGDRAAVEITPDAVTVRRAAPNAPAISTNHHRGSDAATTGLCRRYDRLRRDAAGLHGRADVESLRQMLQHVQQGDFTLQSMVFEPSTRVLYLATGTRAANRKLHRLDLAPYFTTAAESPPSLQSASMLPPSLDRPPGDR